MESRRLDRRPEPSRGAAAESLNANLRELAKLCAAEDSQLAGLFEKVEDRLNAVPPSADCARIPAAVYAVIVLATPRDDPSRLIRAQRHVVGRLLLANAGRLMRRHPQAEIADLLRGNFDRIAQNLLARGDDYADYDFFQKDVNYVTGDYVPCGAQAVSLIGKISVMTLLCRAALASYPSRRAWAGAVMRSGNGWLRTHTDPRILDDFHEAGWAACYRNAAALLKDRPNILGLAATSWFFDPQILTVSPRLAYLQSIPLKHGAFLFNHGPGPYHTAFAIEKSKTRRKLVEAGRYKPQCYSLTWPRESLCEWAGV